MKYSGLFALLSIGLLGGCVAVTVVPGGPPLVSAQYPPGTGAVNAQSQPQPIGSLPYGAANLGPGGSAVQLNYGSFTFGGR